MIDAESASPLTLLTRAAARAFPKRKDLASFKFDGSLAQAWETLARMLAITPMDLARKIAPVWEVRPAENLDHVPAEALAQIAGTFCQKHNLLPLRIEEGHLVLATANPYDENVNELARFASRKPLRWELAPPQDIEDAAAAAYAREALRLATAERGVAGKAEASGNAVVKLGRTLLEAAIDQRASDFHVQPFLGSFAVRIRVDGVLRRMTLLPEAVATNLIRHFKARSGMDPSNAMIPQDGRMSLVHGEREFDMRVSTLPATRGERLVIRFLDQSRVHRLGGAGFSLASLQILRSAMLRPQGMVVMTGPTGCGKTSTLYGALAELNDASVNIITVENPVEYRIPGISQVEVNEKAGRTFAASLRSILRQDPDVVLIGEIRDPETAEIATQAALTGHLVLTTLHTNDAITAIPRLLNLGVQPTILADSLAVVIAQRLCRRLCPHCRVPVAEPLLPEEHVFQQMTHNVPGYRAVGCKLCDFTGYRGRLPIVDVIEMSQGLRDAVAVGETRISELEKLRTGGLKSLAASGSLRVISGDTTVAEVMDAVGPAFWPELATHYGTEKTAAIDLAPRSMASGQGVLLLRPQGDLAARLEPALKEEGLRLAVAETPEAAGELLRKDENIAFIIGDVPDSASEEAAAHMFRENRLHISWARLPALVLLPPPLAGHQEAFRESGVLAEFMSKPVDPVAIVQHIQRAHAR